MFTMPSLVRAERQNTSLSKKPTNEIQVESTAKDTTQQRPLPLVTAILPRLEPGLSGQKRFCFGPRIP
jgi:hypothetical protein